MYGLQYIKELNRPKSLTLTKILVPDDIFKSINRCDVANIEEATGKEYIEVLYCDSSGFGGQNEPSLTIEQLTEKIKELMDEHGQIYSCITNEGQFQVYISIYK